MKYTGLLRMVTGGRLPAAKSVAANTIDETMLKDALIADFTEVVVATGDSFLLGDADDSGNTKRDTIQGILDLVTGGFTVIAEAATTSGTTVDLTVPNGVNMIVVNFTSVGTNGTSALLVQLGDAGGVETSGYLSAGREITSADAVSGAESTAGMIAASVTAAAHSVSGQMILTRAGDNEDWNMQAQLYKDDGGTPTQWYGSSGLKTLSAAITTVRVTTVSADTFDEGSVNVLHI